MGPLAAEVVWPHNSSRGSTRPPWWRASSLHSLGMESAVGRGCGFWLKVAMGVGNCWPSGKCHHFPHFSFTFFFLPILALALDWIIKLFEVFNLGGDARYSRYSTFIFTIIILAQILKTLTVQSIIYDYNLISLAGWGTSYSSLSLKPWLPSSSITSYKSFSDVDSLSVFTANCCFCCLFIFYLQ